MSVSVSQSVSQSVNFGTPSISQERLKLKTSNLARRLATSSPKQQKCKIRSKGVVKGSRDLLLEFWDPFHISGTVKLETSNLACRLATSGPMQKNAKTRSKGVVKGLCDLLFKFWDPLYISGTVEARNIKFGKQIGHWGT